MLPLVKAIFSLDHSCIIPIAIHKLTTKKLVAVKPVFNSYSKDLKTNNFIIPDSYFLCRGSYQYHDSSLMPYFSKRRYIEDLVKPNVIAALGTLL